MKHEPINPWENKGLKEQFICAPILDFKKEATLRFIPGYRKFAQHFLSSAQGKSFPSHDKDYFCPLCKIAKTAWDSENKTLYDICHRKIRYDCWVYHHEIEKFVLWTFGVKVQRQVSVFAKKYGDPINYDFLVTKSSSGFGTEYHLFADRPDKFKIDYSELKPIAELRRFDTDEEINTIIDVLNIV